MVKRIGIIGYGHMGAAIAERARASYEISVYDKDIAKTKSAQGVSIVASIKELVDKSEAIILAVKPQDFDFVLAEIGSFAKDKLTISIAAGIETSYIEKQLKGARVVRVMPNLPAKIGKGMSCIAGGSTAKDTDLKSVVDLFTVLGKALVIDEQMMDNVTAISGSGPGFEYDLFILDKVQAGERKRYVEESFIPQLTKAAVILGFHPETAKTLAVTTGNGALAYLEVTRLSPAEALAQVQSKGGTTEAGVKVLKGLATLDDAVKAAAQRSKELSKK